MLRLRGSERVVRKPDRFVSRLHQIEHIQNLLEDRDPVPHQVVIRASGVPSGSQLPSFVVFGFILESKKKPYKKICSHRLFPVPDLV